jgi:hypothetical protein
MLFWIALSLGMRYGATISLQKANTRVWFGYMRSPVKRNWNPNHRRKKYVDNFFNEQDLNLEHYQERGTRVNRVSYSEMFPGQVKPATGTKRRGLLSESCLNIALLCPSSHCHSHHRTLRCWSILSVVVIWLVWTATCLVRWDTLWGGSISPFCQWPRSGRSDAWVICHTTKYFFFFLRAWRSLWIAGLSVLKGRAIAQAVSRRLPTAAARVQTRVWSCEILWWTKVAVGHVFSENFCFPCQYTFHLLLHNHRHYHPRLAQ